MSNAITTKKTKLATILEERGLSYRAFQDLIKEKTGAYIGFDRISKMVLGKQTDIKVSTASKIAQALGLTIDDISEH